MALACPLDDTRRLLPAAVPYSGYYAESDNWRAYEAAASNVYASHGVSVLHTKDFRDRKKEFRGWSSAQQGDFLAELFEAVNSCDLFGLSFCATKSVGASFKGAHKKASQSSIFSMLFSMILDELCRKGNPFDLRGSREVSFFVESGNHNNQGIQKLFNDMKRKRQAEGAKSLSFVGKQDCLAIHLADFWAFYSMRHARKALQSGFDASKGPFFDEICGAAFSQAPHYTRIFSGLAYRSDDDPNAISVGAPQTYYYGPQRA